MQSLQPDDVRAAATLAYETLTPMTGAAWSVPAGELEWDCYRTLEHVLSALDKYCRYLASPTEERPPRARLRYPDLSPADLPTIVQQRAGVLAAVASASPPTARGFHNWGRSDPEGYLAMGCAEILVHTDDISRGLGITYQPPEALCQRVVGRLFPWAPTDADPWSALRWATGRQPLPGHDDTPANWAWHASPVEEWDGTVKTWDSYGYIAR